MAKAIIIFACQVCGVQSPVWLSRACEEIDRVLAAHYGFTGEELDFIPSTVLRAGINYDIKYPMGRDAEANDE